MRIASPKNIMTGMLLIIFTIGSDAQSSNERFKLDLKVMTGKCAGSDECTYKNASFPKLFSNFKNVSGFAASGIYMINDHFGSGLSVSRWSMDGWNCSDLTDYYSSSAFITSISPVAYLKSKDLLKIFTFFIQAGPSVSNIKADLKSPVFYTLKIPGGFADDVLSSNEINIGGSFSAGSVISITRAFGITIAGSWNITGTKSIIYPDKTTNIFSIDAGLDLNLNEVVYQLSKIRGFHILKNKRYYY